MLVVYNTCGISKNDIQNKNYYCQCLDSILSQKFKHFRCVWSSCLNDPSVEKELKSKYGNYISYSFIDEILPVNITFNHSVLKMVQKTGNFDSYIYLDCGVDIGNDVYTLQKLYEIYKSGPYAMVGAECDDDMGIRAWFKVDFLSEISNGQHFVIPIGKCLNLHAQLFSDELFKKYNNRLLPDIFYKFGTESTFSFLCAAIQKKWIFHNGLRPHHNHYVDGASSGFPITFCDGAYWNHTFRCDKTMWLICQDKEGIDAGFGYEELEKVLLHKESEFDENYFCKNDRLYPWLKKTLYHSKNTFDYSTIKHRFFL